MFKNGKRLVCRTFSGLLGVALLIISVNVTNASTITVGSHHLLPETANQPIVVSIAHDGATTEAARGMNLRAQIGDGNGLSSEPAFHGTLGSFGGLDLTGSIWDGLAGGSTVSGNGVPRTGFGSLGSVDLTSDNPSENVSTNGTLLTLLVDTTGFGTPDTFDLSLSGTALGDTTLVAADGTAFAPLDIVNGSITIVPEPSSIFLGLIAMSFLVWPSRRRRG